VILVHALPTATLHVLSQVDVYIYTSVDNKFKWSKSIADNGLTLLWNGTGLDTSEFANVTLAVPLAPTVRQNGSLFAHIITVRSGLSPEPTAHTRLKDTREKWRKERSRAVKYEDLLYTMAPLTRHLVPIRKERTNLVSGVVSESADSNSTSPAAALQKGAMRLSLPLGHSVVVHPASSMKWTALFFAAAGVGRPSVKAAVARYALATLLAPYLYSLHSRQTAEAAAIKREEAQALQKLLAAEPQSPPVTHWKPRLTVRLTQDEYQYPADDLPPKLFNTILFSGLQTGMHVTPHRYAVWGGDMWAATPDNAAGAGGLRYAPELYVEDNTMLYEYGQLSNNASMPAPQLLVELSPISRGNYQMLMTLKEYTKVGGWRAHGTARPESKSCASARVCATMCKCASGQAHQFLQLFTHRAFASTVLPRHSSHCAPPSSASRLHRFLRFRVQLYLSMGATLTLTLTLTRTLSTLSLRCT
jgi:hypothetical protein